MYFGKNLFIIKLIANHWEKYINKKINLKLLQKLVYN